MTPLRRRAMALSYILALILALAFLAVPVLTLAQGDETKAEVAADAYLRDAELVVLSRADGHIIIHDYSVGANMTNLEGKYDSWGGPYYDVAAGDFNGDGTRELVAIGGGAVGTPGPIMHTFDPVRSAGEIELPSIGRALQAPYVWQRVATGDIDGDGRDEIVAVRTLTDPNNNQIQSAVECYEFTNVWVQRWAIPTSGGFNDLTLGDFDADGKADIGFVRTGSRVLVLDGENPNQSHFELIIGGGLIKDWTRIRILDVTGDGTRDVVLMRPQQSVAGNWPAAVLIIHPTGVNTYTDDFGWGFGNPPEDMEVGDTNGDGKPEIVVMNSDQFAKMYILNPRLANDQLPGLGNRTEAEVWIGDNLWSNLQLGDTNGDGKPQPLFMRGSVGDHVRIYYQESNQEYMAESRNNPYWDNFIAVNLDGAGVVTGPAMVVPTDVTLYYVGGATATTSTIRIGNMGTGTFTWTASKLDTADWLTLSAATGTSNAVLTFSINTAALPAGTANARVQIVAAGTQPVTNGSQVVNVHLVQVPQLTSSFLPVVFN